MKNVKLITGMCCLTMAGMLMTSTSVSADIWINEFHYEDDGADTGEFVEVVLSPDETTPLSQITVTLYNGANGDSYGAVTLDHVSVQTGDVVDGFEFYYFLYTGIQNGGIPDGLALSTSGEGLIEFLSYEGSFTADSGIANGVTSVDVGVEESDSGPNESSLGLTGTGSMSSDFTWVHFDGMAPRGLGSNVATPGSLNYGQTVPAPGVLALLGAAGLIGSRRRRA